MVDAAAVSRSTDWWLESEGTQRATNVWLNLRCCQDRRSIAGTYRVEDADANHYVESNYTFTRTK